MRNLVQLLIVLQQFLCCVAFSTAQEAIRQEGFFYTNPLLDCEPSLNYLPPFKSEISELINERIKTGKARKVSLYFRQLNNGYSFGINENEKYAPASLLKVGDMLYVLKQAQQNPKLLSTEVTYDAWQSHYDSIKGMPTKLKLGEKYKVSRLLTEMIVNSDNESIHMIENMFETKHLWRSVFSDLGVDINLSAGRTRIISPKEYSTFFRVLYNASYLNRKMSGIGLDLLCNTTHNLGIVAGVNDKTVQIANKYGSRITPNDTQFHETAIVYLKGNPYLISIMTEGTESTHLNDVIKDIAVLVHTRCSDAIDALNLSETSMRSVANRDTLLSPLIDCTEKLDELEPFSRTISDLLKHQLLNAELEDVSVYFRHLSNGKWFAINQDVNYYPGQLVNIPSLLSLMKGMEHDHQLKSQQIRCQFLDVEFLGDKDRRVQFGKEYTVLDLMERSIIYDDNTAADMLFNQLNSSQKLWSELFSELGVNHWNHPSSKLESRVSVKDLALLFRVLYNSTILNRNNSEMALRIIESKLQTKGIRSGLPEGTITATQFSEVESYGNEASSFVHDFGIVYHEDNPYQLCIMTKGSSVELQNKVIEEISSMVFKQVSRQVPLD